MYVRILELRVTAALHELVDVLTWKRFERLGVLLEALLGQTAICTLWLSEF